MTSTATMIAGVARRRSDSIRTPLVSMPIGMFWMCGASTDVTAREDAVPLTVGQEWSGWAAQLETAAKRVEASQSELYRLAAGGAAVGTGLNAPHNFGPDIAADIASLTRRPFVTTPNKFEARGPTLQNRCRHRHSARPRGHSC